VLRRARWRRWTKLPAFCYVDNTCELVLSRVRCVFEREMVLRERLKSLFLGVIEGVCK
jgi:hypothetical protein